MKKLLFGTLGVLLLLAFSSATFAQGDQAAGAKTDTKKTTTKKASNNTNFAGTVSAVSATSVTVKGKTEKTATINDKTKFKNAKTGKEAAASDMKEGEYVHVWATKDKSGDWIATTIRIGKPAAKKASTSGEKKSS